MRNTSLELSWDLKAEMLSEFFERMRDSGYRKVQAGNHAKYFERVGQNGGRAGERRQTHQQAKKL